MNQARQRKTPTPSRLNAATRPSCNFTLFYIDDSGSEAAGCTTFSWIEISPATWTDAADRWNNYRTALYERYGIPTADRLHATDLATGRGYRTRGTAGKKSADHGRQILRHGIETIASLPGAAVGSVYRRTTLVAAPSSASSRTFISVSWTRSIPGYSPPTLTAA